VKKALGLLLALVLTAELLWAQQTLPITRVLLSKNGMAYVVRRGQLTAPISLTFHPEDMNDVLKSFTAWNPTTGALYSVGYTTGIPSSHMLGRFPFDIRSADVGMGGFLTQVKGVDIRLDLGGNKLEGKLVAVQNTDRVVTQQTLAKDYRLTVLLADGSLQSVWLSEVRSVEFVDPTLRDQLRAYLDVLAEGRQDVTREVSVYPVPGPGPIQVAYLQQFPLWKTSYRVDLSQKESRIQGWAQIDNPTGESWENVEVSLLSGSPVSFVMNLYDPLYTNRTTVAVPGGQVAAPRQYESVVRDGLAVAAVPPAAGPRGAAGAAAPGGGGGGRGGGGAVAQSPPPPAVRANFEAAAGVFQQAEATQVADFFEYRFPFPVRLASRQSALLPFLQKTANIERLSIYNPQTDRGNPQLGARIDNNTDIPFEPGPITFFEEGRYTGEAVLAYLPRGDKRLVSYGVDYDLQLSSRQESRPETTTRLTVSRGIAVLYMERVQTTTYEIRNKGTLNKTLIIEHPRQGNAKLQGTQPWETTDSFHRFRVTLTPGQSTQFPVSQVLQRTTNVTLSTLTRAQLVMFAGRETPQDIRQKLGQIVDLQEQVAKLQEDARQTQASIDTVFRDQDRLRENIKSLRDTREEQELRSRYLGQLSKQEEQIQASRAHIEQVNTDIAAAQVRLGDLISNLSWQ
jgi:hypothetical protein